MNDDACRCFDTRWESGFCPVHTPDHRRRMDEYEQARNREILAMAEAILAQPTGTWVDEMRARALLARLAECEAQRLTEKARWMPRAER